jgi:YidC/Oxa1 family membrane protein insertase
MEKRVLLAIFLAFLVLYVWQTLFVKPLPKPVGVTATTAAPSNTGRGTAPGSAAAPVPAAASPEAPVVPPATALVADPGERDVRVETQDVVAVFTNRGARLKSWRLKHYFDQLGLPQELIENGIPSQPLPFTLRTPNGATDVTLNTALYAVGGDTGAPGVASPVDLRFEYRDSAGLHALKEFHLDRASFILSFRATVSQGDRRLTPAILWGPAVGDIVENSRYVKKAEGLLYQGEKVVRLLPAAVAKQASYEGEFAYAGVEDNYFMAVALAPGTTKVSYQAVTVPQPAESKDPPRELMAFTLEPKRSDAMKFFIGPKDFDVLAAIDRDVVKAIDFGMFTVIVVPLLRSLKWVNGFVGNYGWSIIILTIIINGIMFPLRHKGMVSMRKMQEIQPEVKVIQERYAKFKATDPAKQKMNQELMALYKERGVNPASGCVPMLLPMPVLLAMWALLSTAIELRGAPFFGWIHDLSTHDPYYVAPILMGMSQFWQQRLTPAAGADPAQQKMMMFMPVVFTAMFLWAPAGLAIYYGTTNLWSIGQQYLANRLVGPPRARTIRPAAERRVKRAGAGKTDAASREEKNDDHDE